MFKRSKIDCRKGFTLVELLIVILVIAILAAIAIPKFTDAGTRSRESRLKANLKLLRNAVTLFNNETGAYPAMLSDLAVTSAPGTGLSNSAASKTIIATDWHGPYIMTVPADPVSNASFTYSTTSGTVGQVSSSSGATALDGTAYSSW